MGALLDMVLKRKLLNQLEDVNKEINALKATEPKHDGLDNGAYYEYHEKLKGLLEKKLAIQKEINEISKEERARKIAKDPENYDRELDLAEMNDNNGMIMILDELKMSVDSMLAEVRGKGNQIHQAQANIFFGKDLHKKYSTFPNNFGTRLMFLSSLTDPEKKLVEEYNKNADILKSLSIKHHDLKMLLSSINKQKEALRAGNEKVIEDIKARQTKISEAAQEHRDKVSEILSQYEGLSGTGSSTPSAASLFDAEVVARRAEGNQSARGARRPSASERFAEIYAESEERVGRQIRRQNEASDQILEDVYNGTTVAIKERGLGESEEEFESDGSLRETIQQMYKTAKLQVSKVKIAFKAIESQYKGNEKAEKFFAESGINLDEIGKSIEELDGMLDVNLDQLYEQVGEVGELSKSVTKIVSSLTESLENIHTARLKFFDLQKGSTPEEVEALKQQRKEIETEHLDTTISLYEVSRKCSEASYEIYSSAEKVIKTQQSDIVSEFVGLLREYNIDEDSLDEIVQEGTDFYQNLNRAVEYFDKHEDSNDPKYKDVKAKIADLRKRFMSMVESSSKITQGKIESYRSTMGDAEKIGLAIRRMEVVQYGSETPTTEVAPKTPSDSIYSRQIRALKRRNEEDRKEIDAIIDEYQAEAAINPNVDARSYDDRIHRLKRAIADRNKSIKNLEVYEDYADYRDSQESEFSAEVTPEKESKVKEVLGDLSAIGKILYEDGKSFLSKKIKSIRERIQEARQAREEKRKKTEEPEVSVEEDVSEKEGVVESGVVVPAPDSDSSEAAPKVGIRERLAGLKVKGKKFVSAVVEKMKGKKEPEQENSEEAGAVERDEDGPPYDVDKLTPEEANELVSGYQQKVDEMIAEAKSVAASRESIQAKLDGVIASFKTPAESKEALNAFRSTTSELFSELSDIDMKLVNLIYDRQEGEDEILRIKTAQIDRQMQSATSDKEKTALQIKKDEAILESTKYREFDNKNHIIRENRYKLQSSVRITISNEERTFINADASLNPEQKSAEIARVDENVALSTSMIEHENKKIHDLTVETEAIKQERSEIQSRVDSARRELGEESLDTGTVENADPPAEASPKKGEKKREPFKGLGETIKVKGGQLIHKLLGGGASLISKGKEALTRGIDRGPIKREDSGPRVEDSTISVSDGTPTKTGDELVDDSMTSSVDGVAATPKVLGEEDHSDVLDTSTTVADSASVVDDTSSKKSKKGGFFSRLFGGFGKKKEPKAPKIDGSELNAETSTPVVDAVDPKVPRVEESGPRVEGVDANAPRVEENGPKIERVVLNAENGAPVAEGVDVVAPKVDAVDPNAPRVEKSGPKVVEVSTPRVEENGPKVERVDASEILDERNGLGSSDTVVAAAEDESEIVVPTETKTSKSDSREAAAPQTPQVSTRLKVSEEEKAALIEEARKEVIAKYGPNAFKGKKKNIAEIMLTRITRQKINKLLGRKANMKATEKKEIDAPTTTTKTTTATEAVDEKEDVLESSAEFADLESVSFDSDGAEMEEVSPEVEGVELSFAEIRKVKQSVKAQVIEELGEKAFTGKLHRNLSKKAIREINRRTGEVIAAKKAEMANPEPKYNTSVLREGLGAEAENIEKDGLSEYLVAFANKYSQYYADGKGTKGKPHTPEEIAYQRKLNAAMVKFVSINAEKFSTNGDGGIDKAVFDSLTNPVSEFNIEELVSNEQVTMNLFQIAASGVYNDNGNVVKLTRKQLVALSGVLVKVAQRKMAIENKKAQETEGLGRAQDQTLEGEKVNE